MAGGGWETGQALAWAVGGRGWWEGERRWLGEASTGWRKVRVWQLVVGMSHRKAHFGVQGGGELSGGDGGEVEGKGRSHLPACGVGSKDALRMGTGQGGGHVGWPLQAPSSIVAIHAAPVPEGRLAHELQLVLLKVLPSDGDSLWVWRKGALIFRCKGGWLTQASVLPAFSPASGQHTRAP